MKPMVTEQLRKLFDTARRPDGRRWTLEQVAEATGLSVSYIWRLRSGRATNPTRLVLEKLASFFGVPVTYFMVSSPESESVALPLGEREVEGALQEAANLSASGNVSAAEEVARRALERANGLGSPRLVAKSWVTLARILARADKLEEARAAVSSAFALLEGSPAGPEWIQAVLTLSYLEFLEDRFASAYFHARQALAALDVAKGDKLIQYEVLFHVGTLARRVGRVDEALVYLEQARLMAQELGERQLAPALMNLGLAALDADQASVALEHFRQALALSVRLRSPIEVNRAQHNIGLAYERLGQWKEAIESLTKSLGSHEALGDMRLVAYDHMELGWCYANTGQRDDALRHALTALAVAQEHERPGDKARAHWHLGRVLATLHELDEATSHYEKAVQLLEELSLAAELPKAQVEYADLLMRKGEVGRAAELYRKAAVFLMQAPSAWRDILSGPAAHGRDIAITTTGAEHKERASGD